MHRVWQTAVLATALGGGLPARAQLVWEHCEATIRGRPGQASVHASFPFRNAGDYAVKIRRIRTSCGCTTASLAKRQYQPGERGRLDVTMKTGGVRGRPTKVISVMTDDASAPAQQLSISAVIPVWVRLSRAVVFWHVDDAPKPQTVTVDVLHEAPIQVTGVSCRSSAFDVRLQTLKLGRRYEISVRPRATGVPARATITLATDYPPDSPLSYTLQARVMRRRGPDEPWWRKAVYSILGWVVD